MITKAQVKHIRSLDDKNNRLLYKQYVIEGSKMLQEAIYNEVNLIEIYCMAAWHDAHKHLISPMVKVFVVDEPELARISHFTTPNQVLAIASLPVHKLTETIDLLLALDGIQDPGNLGTIIRIADWFGISHILCSPTTAHCFSHKVVQASMGSIFRVKCLYDDLNTVLPTMSNTHEIYAAVLNGTPLNTISKIKKGIILIGNESQGIQKKLLEYSTHKISIASKGKAESLNAAVATGILCYALL